MPRLRAPEYLKLMVAGTGLAVVTAGLTAAPAQSAPPLSAVGQLVYAPQEPIESGPLQAVPLPELSTETSTTQMLPSGEYELDVSAVPVNFLNEAGEWVPISTELVPPTEDSDSPETPASEYAAENEAAGYTASIPADAAETPARFKVDDVAGLPGGEAWVALQMRGLTGEPVIEDDTATFSGVENADAVELQATGEGLKETIVLDSAPAAGADPLTYEYDVNTSDGITPRLTAGGVIEFVRTAAPARGPVFSIPVGNMYDSATETEVDGAAVPGPAYSTDVTYALNRVDGAGSEGPSWELIVTPDAGWLADSDRVYPVMIDPTVTFGPTRDCTLMQDQPTSARCGDNQRHLRVGRVASGDSRRAILHFDISSIDPEATIDHSNLELWLDPAETTGTAETGYVVQRTGLPFSGGATWRSTGTRNWNTNGGDPVGPEEGLNRLSGTSESAGWRYFDITPITNLWHQGTTRGGVANNGVVLKQRFENVTNQITFLSSSSQNAVSRRPNLNVIYTPAVQAQAGDRGYWEFEERKLTDRITAKTNIGNGNLLLTAQDASVAGVAGWDMSLTRYYNSALGQTGATSNMGAGWSHGFGGAVRLEFPNGTGNRSRLRFWGPTGYRVFFNQVGSGNDYDREEPGINADLRLNPNTDRYELKFFDESVFLFDRLGQLQSMRDKNGNALAFSYRSQDNRLGSVTDTRGRVAELTYNSGGLITAVTIRRPAGEGGATMLRWEYTYSQPAGQIAQMTSSRLVSFDSTSVGGTTEDSSVDQGGNVAAQTSYTYTENGRLLQVRDARENAQSTGGGASGGTTQFTYDGSTNRVKTVRRVTDDGAVPDSLTSFTYFQNSGLGSASTCNGEADADATFRTHVNGERDDLAADQQDVTRYCIDRHGRVLRTSDARNNVRSTEWTGNSNVLSADMSGTGTGSESYQYGYDGEDNPTSSQSPETSTTGATYTDPAHQHSATSSTDDQGNVWRFSYDDRNNLTNARSQQGQDAPNVEYRYCWTAQGQIERIDPVSASGTEAWGTRRENGQCVSNGNGQGDDTLFAYNANRELVTVNRPAGGDQTFTYDNLSRIRTVTDGRGVTTSFTYDALDRVIRSVYSQSGQMDQTVEWDYDLAGNLVRLNDDNGTNEFTYDELNRKVGENAQNPSGATEFQYDSAGNVRVSTVGGEPNPTRYTYDNLNRVVTLADQRGGQAITRFEYDRRDNRTRTILPILNSSGQAISNSLIQKSSYDADGKVKCVFSYRQADAPGIDLSSDSRECPNSTFAGLITYRGYDYRKLNGGPRTSTKYEMVEIGNRRTAYRYDAIKRLTSAVTGPAETPLRSFAYAYDRHSNLTSETARGTTPGLQPGRLQMAHTLGDEICGSIRQTGDAPLTCSSNLADQTSYAHDGSGNMTSASGSASGAMAGLELTYNLPGQTSSIQAPGADTPVTQSYDGVMQDRRTDSGETSMSYGFSGLSAESSGGTTPSSSLFVRDPDGALIALLSRDVITGEVEESDYYLTDDQDSVLATYDGSGSLSGDGVIRYLYEPYGQLIRSWTQPGAGTAGTDGAENAELAAPTEDRNPFTYVSGYFDRSSGLLKFGTRFYIPELATWTQPDPKNGRLTNPLSLNRYQYGQLNPISNSDPSGRELDVDALVYACAEGAVESLLVYGVFGGAPSALAAAVSGCAGNAAVEGLLQVGADPLADALDTFLEYEEAYTIANGILEYAYYLSKL